MQRKSVQAGHDNKLGGDLKAYRYKGMRKSVDRDRIVKQSGFKSLRAHSFELTLLFLKIVFETLEM